MEEEFEVILNDRYPLMVSASFGADRNTRGGEKLRFPIVLRREDGLTAPKASVTPTGSILRLPLDWGVWKLAKRALRFRVVRREGGARILDKGDNFLIAAGPAGSSLTIAYEWYNKAGRWSATEEDGCRVVFNPRPAREADQWIMADVEPLSVADLVAFQEKAEEVAL